ncbi:MAG TPA: hypothetical protein VNX25_03225 [Verrucomicrobiae bacterium]|nr:hypothetical protein [Verrucomicrobiae bacterium]
MSTGRICKLILPIVAAAALSACATPGRPAAKILWGSREQFVALVPADGPGPRNAPPAPSPADLRARLAALQVRPAKGEPRDLLGKRELEVVAEQGAAALRQAEPGEDVVFAVIGKKPVLDGLLDVEMVTTGRMFYADGALHLILGLVHERIVEKDRRLQPFTPGSRLLPSTGFTVTDAAGTVRHAEGRPDWLLLAAATEPAPAPAAPQAPHPSPAPSSIEERLRVLLNLRTKGLIDEDEYRERKKSILREL